MRIGIANDVAMAREALRRVVQSSPENQVAWLAKDGDEAVAFARRDRPDVILMDLIMPRTDGAEATRRIMAESPCAILVVTASVSDHMHKVYEAMGHGALDAVDTPALGPSGKVAGAAALLEKIGTVAKLIGKPSVANVPRRPAATPVARQRLGDLVLLGASTGGPKALADILSGFPAGWPAGVIIVQHVDAAFAPSLAHWLGAHSPLPVSLVEEGRRPEPGHVFLAATNDHLVMAADRTLWYSPEPVEFSFRPSLDVFFASVAAHWPDPGSAVLLTGMGRDGASGLLTLRQEGWQTIAQDQATSVVWGMPKAAVELGAASRVLPVGRIAEALVTHLRTKTSA